MKRIRVILTIGAAVGLLSLFPPGALAQEATEIGSRHAGNLEITLLAAPPLSSADMQRMMRGMEGMGGMPGMGGMGGGAGQPTHYIGVLVRDVNADQVVRGLDVTLTAQRDGMTRTVKLMPMPGSYGANISLPEKGKYTMRVTIVRSGHPLHVVFEFDYR